MVLILFTFKQNIEQGFIVNEVLTFFKYLPKLSKIIFMLRNNQKHCHFFFAKSYASIKAVFKQH